MHITWYFQDDDDHHDHHGFFVLETEKKNRPLFPPFLEHISILWWHFPLWLPVFKEEQKETKKETEKRRLSHCLCVPTGPFYLQLPHLNQPWHAHANSSLFIRKFDYTKFLISNKKLVTYIFLAACNRFYLECAQFNFKFPLHFCQTGTPTSERRSMPHLCTYM